MEHHRLETTMAYPGRALHGPEAAVVPGAWPEVPGDPGLLRHAFDYLLRRPAPAGRPDSGDGPHRRYGEGELRQSALSIARRLLELGSLVPARPVDTPPHRGGHLPPAPAARPGRSHIHRPWHPLFAGASHPDDAEGRRPGTPQCKAPYFNSSPVTLNETSS